MKAVPTLAIATLLSFAGPGSSLAQTYVLESPIALTAAIMTQGTDTVTRTTPRGTVTTKRLVTTPFTNRELLAAMVTRGLIASPASDWVLLYLEDGAGQGGAYVRKKPTAVPAADPVLVPADLLTLPVFGPTLKRGTEVSSARGTAFQGAGEMALATCTVKGIPVSGLANSGLHMLNATIQGAAYQLDTASTTLAFTGGIDGDPSDQLIKGMIVVGNARMSPHPKLPQHPPQTPPQNAPQTPMHGGRHW